MCLTLSNYWKMFDSSKENNWFQINICSLFDIEHGKKIYYQEVMKYKSYSLIWIYKTRQTELFITLKEEEEWKKNKKRRIFTDNCQRKLTANSSMHLTECVSWSALNNGSIIILSILFDTFCAFCLEANLLEFVNMLKLWEIKSHQCLRDRHCFSIQFCQFINIKSKSNLTFTIIKLSGHGNGYQMSIFMDCRSSVLNLVCKNQW